MMGDLSLPPWEEASSLPRAPSFHLSPSLPAQPGLSWAGGEPSLPQVPTLWTSFISPCHGFPEPGTSSPSQLCSPEWQRQV